MKSLFIVLVFLLANSLHAEDAGDKTEMDYWKETTFTVEKALSMFVDGPVEVDGQERVMPNGTCYSGPDLFLACVQAVRSLGMELTPQVSFILTADFTQPWWKDAKFMRDIYPMALIRGEVSGEVLKTYKPQKVVELEQTERTQILETGSKLIEQARKTGHPPIDFHAIITSLKALAPADIPEGKLAVAIGSGFIRMIDAHGHLDLKAMNERQSKHADQSLVGVGAELSTQNGQIWVARAIPGSPAEKVLKSGDAILNVNGQIFKDNEVNKLIQYLHDPAQSVFHVKIQRGSEQVDAELTRGKVEIENVASWVTDDMGIKLGYIRLKIFVDNEACSKIESAITKMETKDKVEGFILDLRSNPGGSLDQAVCIGRLFVGPKTVVYVKDLKTEELEPQSQNLPAVTKKPLVVLINGSSASASEVVSGALQGLERAWVVGDRSFGKASVQEGSDFAYDRKIQYFRTIARFYVPMEKSDGTLDMRTNQRVGVEPDFKVPVRPGLTEDELFVMREGDRYPGSLTAETTSWDSLRPSETAQIQKCLDAGKRADGRYATKMPADYQLLKAQEVLACQLGK